MTERSEPPLPESPPGPTRVVDPAVPALEERLGVALPDAALALAALTHKSYVNEHRGEALSDNERLEFLGDAVIDLAVAHRLMERFPAAREGELSKVRAAVVDEAGLARIARELDLGALLRLGRGEELTGGRQKSSLLADALEAVIAAVYLVGGLEPVLGIVDRFLGEAFARAAEGTLDRDYKTQFQELAQSRLRATPRYRVVAERGPDHSKIFEVELELRGEGVGRGEGRSKKDAEQAAAKMALDAMNGNGKVEVAVEGPIEVVIPVETEAVLTVETATETPTTTEITIPTAIPTAAETAAETATPAEAPARSAKPRAKRATAKKPPARKKPAARTSRARKK